MDTQLNSEPINNKVKLNFKDSKYATGRRKKSIARVWLKKGTGNIQINGKRINEYFKKLNEFQPDVIGISALSDERHLGFELSRLAKEWNKNAVVIWDNRSVLHYAIADFFPGRGLGHERIMDRIAIEGDRPN